MANIVASVIATFNGKALTKGKKEISAFDKTVKKLGKTFATTFGAYQLLAFSKKAVAAFAADEKAAKSLEVQLKNTGFAFSAPGVEAYIGNLQKLYGVLDDELRPAFQQLLTATGSITKSQDALETALNVSAATGKSLSEVSAALTRGFSGNTTGLTRLGAGLSKATLKTGDMDKIMAELNAKFAGQAAARLGTFAGKMDLITVASADAKEIIGKGLVDALTALGDDKSIGNFTDSMTELAKGIADVTRGIGELGRGIQTIANLPGLKQLLTFSYEMSAVGLLQRLGRMSAPAAVLPANKQRSAGRIDAKRFQTEDKLAKAKAAELLLLQKKNAIENKNVEELRKKFDLERIGLTAALNSATDEETKLRLKAQLAILDNNEALAKKLLAEMEAAEALKKLAAEAAAAGKSITEFALIQVRSLINRINAQIELINTQFGIPSAAPKVSAPGLPSQPASYFQDLATQLVGSSSYAGMNVSQIATERARESGNRSLDVNVRIDSPSGDKFAQLVAESIQVAGRSGFSTTGAGQLP
ncbi:MAG: hypothetical protein EBR82_40365 [Caulobacteraceae bacterium]|nr:hypothetical protein [Caulobacteraceae bacterium]